MIKSIINDCRKPIAAYVGSKRVWQYFTPADLFKNGEKGVWLDPSDLKTMFQDVNGTEPVTKDGDPVGLILDKSQSLSTDIPLINTDVVDFNSNNWRFLGKEYSAEKNTFITGADAAGVVLTGLLANRVYKMVATISHTKRIEIKNGSGGASPTVISLPSSDKRVVKLVLVGSSISTPGIYFRLSSGDSSFTLHNIMVAEVKGNHATQPTASARPIYRSGDERGIVNLVLNSDKPSGNGWGGGRSIEYDTSDIAPPPELQTVNKVTATAGNTGITSQAISVEAGKSYTMSIWVAKPKDSNANITLRIGSPDGTQTTPITINNGGRFYRVNTTYNCLTSGTALFGIGGITSSRNPPYIYYGGLQVEEGTEVTEYQRNIDHLGGVGTGKDTDLHWLKFDGVDDSLSAPFNGILAQNTFINIGYKYDTVKLAQTLISTGISGATEVMIGTINNTQLAAYSLKATLSAGESRSLNSTVSVAWDDSGVRSIRRNSDEYISITPTQNYFTDKYPINLGMSFNGSRPMHGRIYGVLIVESTDTLLRERLNSFMMAKSGAEL